MASQKELKTGNPDIKEINAQRPLTVFLDDPRAKDISLTGGKGASLAELNSIPNVKVPEGFILMTPICDQILERNPEIKKRMLDLDQHSEQWLKAKLTQDNAKASVHEVQIREKGDSLKEVIGNLEFPQEAKGEIIRSYRRLSEMIGEKDAEVAIRSSCPLEDGDNFSFAGQYITELHVKGEEDVVKALFCIN